MSIIYLKNNNSTGIQADFDRKSKTLNIKWQNYVALKDNMHHDQLIQPDTWTFKLRTAWTFKVRTIGEAIDRGTLTLGICQKEDVLPLLTFALSHGSPHSILVLHYFFFHLFDTWTTDAFYLSLWGRGPEVTRAGCVPTEKEKRGYTATGRQDFHPPAAS